MFTDNHQYNKSIRNYVVLMGTLFNKVNILRPNKTVPMAVPITYQSKEKFVAYLLHMSNPDGSPNFPELQTILPRMSFFMRKMNYDQKRKVNTLQYSMNVIEVDGVKVYQKQLAPVPYNFEFEVCIYTRYEDDMLQIIEQILPYFQPHFNAKIKEHSLAGVIDRDVYINMVECEPQEEMVGLMADDRRHVVWNLVFELSGYLYPQIQNANVIKTTIVNFVGEEENLLDDAASIYRVTNEVIPESANITDPYVIQTTHEYPNG